MTFTGIEIYTNVPKVMHLRVFTATPLALMPFTSTARHSGGYVCTLPALMGMFALWFRWHQFKKRDNLGAGQVFNQRAYLFQEGRERRKVGERS